MIRNILKDSIVYGISKYLSVFAAIFLMPIYTRLLTKTDYGIMEIINSWNNLIIILIPLGLTSSIIRFYPDVKDIDHRRKSYIGTTLTSILSMCAIYILLMILLRPYFIGFFGNYQGIYEVYNHSLFIGVAAIIFAFFLTLLQAQLRKIYYLIATLTNLIILVTLGFIFVYSYQMGIVGFFRASTIAYASSIIVAIIFTRKDLALSFSRSTLTLIMNYSIHILSVGLLFHLVNLFDRYIISYYGDLSDVGVYSIGVRISGIMGLVISSFALAWFPLSMRIKNDKNAKDIYRRIHDFYLVATSILLIGLILFRKEIVSIFAPSYEAAYEVIAILGCYLVVNGSIYFYSLGLHIKRKTKYITLAGVASIVANVISSVILVKFIGINGVALGTLIGSVIWVVIQYYFSQRLFKISFDFKYILFSLIAVSLFYYVFTTYIESAINFGLLLTLLIKLGLFILIGMSSIFLLFPKSKLTQILSLFKKQEG